MDKRRIQTNRGRYSTFPCEIFIFPRRALFCYGWKWPESISLNGVWYKVSVTLIGLAGFLLNSRATANNSVDSFPSPRNGNTYVIAHRGAHQFAPENSLLAYSRAIELGCDFVEIDIRKTKDGHFVSVHNKRIDAYFEDESGEVKDFTLMELKKFPLGENNEGLDQEYIPTLEEILQLCKGRIGIYLDLKEPDIKAQVQIIKKFDMEREVIWYIPAFYKKAIRQLKMYCDKCIIMPDPGPERNLVKVIERVHSRILASDMDHLNASFVKKAHDRGVKVFVDDEKTTQEEWRQIIDWGTDGIQTDNPEGLIRFIRTIER